VQARQVDIGAKKGLLHQLLGQGRIRAQLHQKSKDQPIVFAEHRFKIRHVITTFHLLDRKNRKSLQHRGGFFERITDFPQRNIKNRDGAAVPVDVTV
jgi:hypothetical protein